MKSVFTKVVDGVSKLIESTGEVPETLGVIGYTVNVGETLLVFLSDFFTLRSTTPSLLSTPSDSVGRLGPR